MSVAIHDTIFQSVALTQIRTVDPAQNNGKKEVVFVDSSVQDYQTLINGVGAGVEIQLIDGSKDGLAQINTWAQTHTGYDAIHILSHGSSGNIHLGTTSLTDANLSQHTTELTHIGNSLTANGDILVYGCNVANGEVGKDFIGKLALATGADIAASDDVTGSADKGGDWVLEAANGAIDTNALAINGFSDVLAEPTNHVIDNTINTGPLGQSLNLQTVTDTNGNIYTLLLDSSYNYVFYKFDGSAWAKLVTVSAGSETSLHDRTSFAVDSSGHIHMATAYGTAGDALDYKYYDGTSWTTTNLEARLTSVGSYGDPQWIRTPKISLDANGKAFISYEKFNNGSHNGDYSQDYWYVNLKTNVSGSWATTEILHTTGAATGTLEKL